MCEDWANGAFTTETADGTSQLNAKALGKIQLLDDIIGLTPETFNESKQ